MAVCMGSERAVGVEASVIAQDRRTKERTVEVLLSARELVVEGVRVVLEGKIVLVVVGVVLVKDGFVDDVVDAAGVAELVVVLRAVDTGVLIGVVLLLWLVRKIYINWRQR